MLRKEDISEVAYGGAVTLAEWQDEKRITKGTLKKSDVVKKIGFWTYMVPGVSAVVASATGKGPRGLAPIAEKVATGFLYDLPRQLLNINKSMSKTTGSAAVDYANAQMARANAQAEANRQLAAGRPTARTYEPEFKTVSVT